jgi:hypothetical protein
VVSINAARDSKTVCGRYRAEGEATARAIENVAELQAVTQTIDDGTQKMKRQRVAAILAQIYEGGQVRECRTVCGDTF